MQKRNSRHIHPWLGLWTAPRTTFQRILDTNPYRLIIWFALISGLLASFITLSALWQQRPQHLDFQSPLFIGAILVIGMIFGIIQLYVISWLYQLTGSWLGGRGTYVGVKCAVGWSMYPMIVSHLLSIIALFFTSHLLASTLLNLASLIIGIWAVVIFIFLLAQAHRFSAWRALSAVLLTLLLIFVAIMLISLLIPLLSPLFLSPV
jgi:hypothetical protein